MAEVVALGEVLIDFTPAGRSESGNPIFERNPGGAPANVLSLLAKLGISTSFIGKAGDDMFGNFLKNILSKTGIDTKGLIMSQTYNTTLAFVELDERGDRSFGFIRNNGADKMLKQDEIDLSLLDGAKVFHFGGVTLTDEPARGTTLYAARKAKELGLTISYDPNFRPPLWKSGAKEILLEGLKLADIVKLSDDECRLLSGKDDIAQGTEFLMKTYGTKLIFVTLGSKGSAARFGDDFIKQKTFEKVKTIDTTGAGDAFLGGMLYCLLKSGKELSQAAAGDIDKYMRFANAAGSLVTTKKGAIMSMPTLSQINELLAQKDA
jgi:fructokinase